MDGLYGDCGDNDQSAHTLHSSQISTCNKRLDLGFRTRVVISLGQVRSCTPEQSDAKMHGLRNPLARTCPKPCHNCACSAPGRRVARLVSMQFVTPFNNSGTRLASECNLPATTNSAIFPTSSQSASDVCEHKTSILALFHPLVRHFLPS